MRSYEGNKNYKWIWIGVDRDAQQYIDMVMGERSTKTGIKLCGKVKEQAIGIIAADYWKSYNEMIPKDMLVQTKAEAYTVESYRETKCCSKSQHMMIL